MSFSIPVTQNNGNMTTKHIGTNVDATYCANYVTFGSPKAQLNDKHQIYNFSSSELCTRLSAHTVLSRISTVVVHMYELFACV